MCCECRLTNEVQRRAKRIYERGAALALPAVKNESRTSGSAQNGAPGLGREDSPVKAYVGLDVHSKSSTYVAEDRLGRNVGKGEVATSPEAFGELVRRLRLKSGTTVALESGTMAFYAARQLRRLQLRPVVIDAHEVRLKAHRPAQKCDQRDAHELCVGIRTGVYRAIVHVPTEAILELREVLSRRRHFVRIQSGEVNAAKRILRSGGYRELSRRSLSTVGGWTRCVKEAPDADSTRTFVTLHFQGWRAAREQVQELERLLEDRLAHLEPAYGHLKSVPGVGCVIAATALAFLSEPERFPDARHAASYAGLIPRMNQSGDVDRDGHITKTGPAELRAMLCEAAHQAARRTSPFHPLFVRLCARIGYKKAITALAHRLCRILYAILRDGSRFDLARLGVEKGPFQVTHTRHYRLRKTASATH